MSIVRIATFILSVFIVGMVEMMVAGIMNLMSQDLHQKRSLDSSLRCTPSRSQFVVQF